MSVILPFPGIRYNLAQAGPLSDLIAPPYDIIGPDLQKTLHHRSPYNVIRLILGQAQPGDDAKTNQYSRAADLWQKWRASGILAKDPQPALYRYQTSFAIKTPAGLTEKTRPGFVALLKLHEYSEGKVLPHERTLAGPKEDRFQLLLRARAHFSQVLMLYPDPSGQVDQALGEAPPRGTDPWSSEDDAGVTHSMWPITDPATIQAVAQHLAARPLYIADGHHRYETALAYRRYLRERSPLFAQGIDYIMAYFTPVEHPGLVIFPYHRLVHNLPQRRLSGLFKKLEASFQIERALLSPLSQGQNRRDFIQSLIERGQDRTVFGMVDGTAGHGYFLSRKPPDPEKRHLHSELENVLSRLDVVTLEDLALIDTLAIKPKDLLNEKYIAYVTDYDRALDAVSQPPNQLAFLMNPTPVRDVIRVADLHGIMPEKSTYFFPKLATGMVMNAMEE